jgi:diguanylate cyclase (GGDEF)-like protein
MQLVIHVDYADMQSDAQSMFKVFLIISVFLLIIFSLITFIITGRIVRPIKELADSADHIVDGKYEFDANSHADAEVVALGTALQKSADKVANYINYINGLAYRDALTGVKNSTAYNEMAVDIERCMRSGEPLRYAILVADLNFLKMTNDMYGHEVGNQFLIRASKVICNVFKHSPVYRIGGDEFVVLLKNEDLESMNELMVKFDECCEREVIRIGDCEIPVSIARGIAEYNPDFHTTFDDVFDCADREMYIHKNKIKQHLSKKNNNIIEIQ